MRPRKAHCGGVMSGTTKISWNKSARQNAVRITPVWHEQKV